MSTRRSAAVVASGLLLGLVPGVALAGDANAAATSIAIRADHSIYVAGQKVVLGIHLVGAPNGTIYVSQTIPGHSASKIYKGQVDANGYAHISGTANYNSTFKVRYGSTSTTDSVSVKVRAKVVTYAVGGTKDGTYHSYAAGKKGKVVGAAGPAKGRKYLSFTLQHHTASGWHTVDKGMYKLNSEGAKGLYVTGKAGDYYRVHAVYAGDPVNASNVSSFAYIKFRR